MERCTLRHGDKVKFEFTIYEQTYHKKDGDLFKARQNTGRKVAPGNVGTVVSIHEQKWGMQFIKDERGVLIPVDSHVQWLVSVDFGDGLIEAVRARSAILVSRRRGTASQRSSR
jgi:hypothetical protein